MVKKDINSEHSPLSLCLSKPPDPQSIEETESRFRVNVMSEKRSVIIQGLLQNYAAKSILKVTNFPQTEIKLQD